MTDFSGSLCGYYGSFRVKVHNIYNIFSILCASVSQTHKTSLGFVLDSVSSHNLSWSNKDVCVCIK